MDTHDGPPPAGNGSALTYNSPLAAGRATRLVEQLAQPAPRDVLDVGCGWAELLLDVLAAVPSARGHGIDEHEPDIERGRESARRRGLSGRVRLEARQADDSLPSADLVLSIGAFQAFGDVPTALTRLRELVRPGGRVLLGCEYWEHTPSDAELAALWEGTVREESLLLPDLVDAAITAGFRPLSTQTVTRQEWEGYESGHMAPQEEWLARHPRHPQAEAVREQLDEQRTIWLRGHRDLLGFAYLTLLPVEVTA